MQKKTHKDLLIVLYRNPEQGAVKTRLAASLGSAAALSVYLQLAAYTRSVISKLSVDKAVYYSNRVEHEDDWPNDRFAKKRQRGDDLGQRLSHAMEEAFLQGYRYVCVIGTDCFELTPQIVTEAFDALRTHRAVIGPAKDGGYYLLGTDRFTPELFYNKSWSTSALLGETLKTFDRLHMSYRILPTLSDVDEEKDLPPNMRRG